MKKIGFIGAYDKTDFILYIAKILTEMGNHVLVIDSTIIQKAKYVVPVINPTRTYFTEFEGIDVAVGFESIEEMYQYIGLGENEELDYEYVLIDVDSSNAFEKFSLDTAEIKYFVTSFDLYSLKKGLEIISGIQDKIKMTKILFSKYMSNAENEYLDFLSMNYNIEWDTERINFPLEQGDQTAIIENQRAAKLKTKNLSPQYRDNLLIMASHISGVNNLTELRKIMKKIDKGE